MPAVSISHNTQRTYKLKIKTPSALTCSLEDGNLCGSMVRLFKSSDMVCKWVISPSIDISSSWKDKGTSLTTALVLQIRPTTQCISFFPMTVGMPTGAVFSLSIKQSLLMKESWKRSFSVLWLRLSFTITIVRYWHKLSREEEDALSLETLKARLAGALSNLL